MRGMILLEPPIDANLLNSSFPPKLKVQSVTPWAGLSSSTWMPCMDNTVTYFYHYQPSYFIASPPYINLSFYLRQQKLYCSMELHRNLPLAMANELKSIAFLSYKHCQHALAKSLLSFSLIFKPTQKWYYSICKWTG